VTTQWLFQCFAQWEKIDEAPFLIDVERDEHGQRDSLPGDNAVLSVSDDDEADEGASDLDDEEDFDNESPIEMTEEQWGTMNDEVDEWLNSDGDDDEDDEGFESDASRLSVQTNGTNGTNGTRQRRKRKREADSVEVSDAENDTDVSVNGLAGSKLEHRKKRARQRTSALNNATSALSDKSSGLPSPDTTGPEEEPVQKDLDGVGEEEDGEDDLAAAMLEELEKEDCEVNAVAV
jgi:RNA polymerase II subunit A C-terminal domain phosphatase